MKRLMYNSAGVISLLAYIWASCLLPAIHVHTHHTTSAVETTKQHDHASHDHHHHNHHSTGEQAPAAPKPVPCDHHDSECLICQHAAAKILTITGFTCLQVVDQVYLIVATSVTLPEIPSFYTPLERGPPLTA